jgi:hypothetical protein
MLQYPSLCHPVHSIRGIEQSSNGTIPTLLLFNILHGLLALRNSG